VATDGATAAVAPTKAIEDAWLEPLEAQAGGPRVDIPLGEVTLGRVAPSNVLLDSPLVSQLHARIERTPTTSSCPISARSTGRSSTAVRSRSPSSLPTAMRS
jgi:hypothetical protein